MLRGRLLFACLTAFAMLITCKSKKHHYCHPSSCGNIPNISDPFRLKGDPQYCGQKRYELSCENSRTILKTDFGRFYVEKINYDTQSLRVVDVGVQKDNCSSLPLYSLTRNSFSYNPYYIYGGDNVAITFISCATPPVNSTLYIDTAVCNNENSSLKSSSLFLQRHTYVVYSNYVMLVSDVEDSCSIDLQAWVSSDIVVKNFNVSFHRIHDALVYGFDLKWDLITLDYIWIQRLYLRSKSFALFLYYAGSWGLMYTINPFAICGVALISLVAALIAARTLCCSPCVFAFLVYKWRRRHLSMYDNIEEFIQSHNKLMPVRYSYSDIKKMTKGFKDKIGEGGYGSVYKGKLRSGHLVAVKILGNSKANGQDFINEVATIGTIYHVNVAQLTGFCAERSKRALVYDFMPNGSLEKYIFPREEGIIFLSLEKLYSISLGVARGIEYLHGGCDMQILHFDIKPHNILLDENFTPKVSDFGLAKLYPTDDSIVNLTAARGTMGYMAPELFYKNIGGVSYKADVYSFGMLLMEMASKRKNLNPFVEHLSQIYFPSWIYDHYSEEKDIEMGDATEEERKIAKKMITVAFWCIQLKPIDRPSMSKVVEMLEGNVELEMPPKPFVSPQDIPVEDHEININQTELSISSGPPTDSISLIVNAI